MKTTAIALQPGGYTEVGFPGPLTGWAVAEAESLLDALFREVGAHPGGRRPRPVGAGRGAPG